MYGQISTEIRWKSEYSQPPKIFHFKHSKPKLAFFKIYVNVFFFQQVCDFFKQQQKKFRDKKVWRLNLIR